jgi:hypothetical protein
MNFPKRNLFLIVLSCSANGNSSYRDATNLNAFCKLKWNSESLLLSDKGNLSKRELFCAIEDTVKRESVQKDILFVISSHGYVHGSHEFIKFKGSTIMDTEIRDCFYSNMDDSCLSLCLIDTCHSGSMMDLPYRFDGKTHSVFQDDYPIKPNSICISACSEQETAGEDISSFGGWGGKLVCQFLDFYSNDLLLFYHIVSEIFKNQKNQISHPILSSSHSIKNGKRVL